MASKQTMEITAIEAALIDAGIPFLGVKHGTGAARAWIEVRVPMGTRSEIVNQAGSIVARILGRESWDKGFADAAQMEVRLLL